MNKEKYMVFKILSDSSSFPNLNFPETDEPQKMESKKKPKDIR